MKDNTKIGCYRDAYNALKAMEGLKNFRWPKEKEHLDFSCVAGDTLIKFRLFTDKDLLQLRAEQQCANQNDEDNGKRISEIAGLHEGMFGTAYDGKAILNMSVPFVSVSDMDAKALVMEKTKEFAQTVISDMADLSRSYEYSSNFEETEALSIAEPQKDFRKNNGIDPFSSVADTATNRGTEENPRDISEGMSPENAPYEYANELAFVEADHENQTDMKGSSNNAGNISGDGEVFPYSFGETTDVDHPGQRTRAIEDFLGNGDFTDGDTVNLQKRQMEYRESLLKDMRELVAREKMEALAIKQESEQTAEKNRLDAERNKDNWNKYNKAKKSLDKRIASLDEREQLIAKKEAQLNSREEEISSKEQIALLIKEENDRKEEELNRAAEENQKCLAELQIRESGLIEREQSVALKESQLEIQRDRIELDRKTVDESIQDMYAMEKMLKELKGKVMPVDVGRYEEQISVLQGEKIKLADTIHGLENASIEMRKKLSAADAEKDVLLGRISILEQTAQEKATAAPGIDNTETERLKNEARELRNRAEAAENRVSGLEADLNESNRLMNELKEKLNSVTKIPVMETLSDAGYSVSPIVGEGDPLLTFSLDGCTVIIDEQLGIACIEKAVKRNYVKTFDGWNSQSFAESYSMSKGKAYCRYAYKDIVEDTRRIAAKLGALK